MTWVRQNLKKPLSPDCGEIDDIVWRYDDVLETTRAWVVSVLVDRDIRMMRKDFDEGLTDYLEAQLKCEDTKPIGAFADDELETEFFDSDFNQRVEILSEESFHKKYGFLLEEEGEHYILGENK